MKKEHKVYDEEFKKTIVSLYESGKKKSDLTREYGISYTNISDWIKEIKKENTLIKTTHFLM